MIYIYPHVLLNLYLTLSSKEQKRRYLKTFLGGS